MKLRYYLRGLGIGIVVTALIFTITAGEKESLSDAEIRERAAQLGMVDSSSLMLSAIQTSAESDESTADQTSKESVKNAESENQEVMQESAATESEETQENTMDEPGTESAQEEESSQAVTGEVTTVNDAEAVTVTVQSGASSLAVCRELEAAGLIEDAEAFDTYLCNNGYSRSVKTGVYKIVPGTSEEEIAEIITKKR